MLRFETAMKSAINRTIKQSTLMTLYEVNKPIFIDNLAEIVQEVQESSSGGAKQKVQKKISSTSGKFANKEKNTQKQQ